MSLFGTSLLIISLSFLGALLAKAGYHIIQRNRKEISLIKEALEYHDIRIESLKNLVIYLFKDIYSFLFKRKEDADALSELSEIRSSNRADNKHQIPPKKRQDQSQSVTENHNPAQKIPPQSTMTVQEILKKDPRYAVAMAEYYIECLNWQTANLRDNTELRNLNATLNRKKVINNTGILIQMEHSLIKERLAFLNGHEGRIRPLNGEVTNIQEKGIASLISTVFTNKKKVAA